MCTSQNAVGKGRGGGVFFLFDLINDLGKEINGENSRPTMIKNKKMKKKNLSKKFPKKIHWQRKNSPVNSENREKFLKWIVLCLCAAPAVFEVPNRPPSSQASADFVHNSRYLLQHVGCQHGSLQLLKGQAWASSRQQTGGVWGATKRTKLCDEPASTEKIPSNNEFSYINHFPPYFITYLLFFPEFSIFPSVFQFFLFFPIFFSILFFQIFHVFFSSNFSLDFFRDFSRDFFHFFPFLKEFFFYFYDWFMH